MRRIPAAALILFAFSAGCSRAATTSERSPSPSTAAADPHHRSTIASSTTIPPTGVIATARPLATATEQQAKTVPAPTDSSPEDSASEFIAALISGQAQNDLIDADLWQHTVEGGHIIQTANLHAAADRATVAVSLAFDAPPGGEEIEPIGLRIELRATQSGWTVDGIGYL